MYPKSALVAAIALALTWPCTTLAQLAMPNLGAGRQLVSGKPSLTDGNDGAVAEVRSQYFEIPVADFIQRHNLTEFDPRLLVSQLLRRSVSLEGRQQETIAIHYRDQSGMTVVEHTTIGLPDDSLRSLRTRIELKRQQGGWQILWVGSQFQCWAGRGHEDWSKEFCF